jgi:hypothetical protein
MFSLPCTNAPIGEKNVYGRIFGEEIIINQIKSGKNKEEIIHEYQEGDIDFKVVSRFTESLLIMKERESVTDIKLTNYISNNYRKNKLFITHNHPTNILMIETVRQILNLMSLKMAKLDLSQIKTSTSLIQTNCPISTFDVKAHGYMFEEDEDWEREGASLIELICNNFHK